MRTLHLLAAVGLAAALAGCAAGDPQESTAEPRARGVSANMPEGATMLIVDVTASAMDRAQVDIRVDAADAHLASDTFEAAGFSDERVLRVATNGSQLVSVSVSSAEVVTIHLVLHAVQEDLSQVVLRDEWFTLADA